MINIEETMVRQLPVDARSVTPEDWRSWGVLERAYAVVNQTGEFAPAIADEVEQVRIILPRWAREFVAIS